MSNNSTNIRDLFGKKGILNDFEIIEMTEVYRTNDDGIKISTIGFFKKKEIAEAFAKSQVDSNYYETDSAIVLTNGIVAYLIDAKGPLKIFNDEEEKLKLRKEIIAKLSPQERKIMGIE